MKAYLVGLLFCVGALSAYGVDTNEEDSTEADLEVLSSQLQKADLKAREDAKVSPLLAVNGRIDLAFSGGAPVAQGFFIPSMRFGAQGTISPRLEYGFSVGQTREFSTAQLPQILPVDAWMNVRVLGSDEESSLRVKVGMFNPTLNPWWTPDLAELAIPDYQSNHRALLLDNDLGMEVHFQPGTQRVKIRLGLFNGNGIYALNTNNAKAFTASLEASSEYGNTRLLYGVSAFAQTQSAIGSVNYKSNWVFDAYASIENGPWLAGVDIMSGGFEDSARVAYPFATGIFVTSRLAEDLHLYVRNEYLRDSPTFSGNLTVWQMGPMVTIDRAFKAFFYYESANGPAGIVNSGQVRLRLVM